MPSVWRLALRWRGWSGRRGGQRSRLASVSTVWLAVGFGRVMRSLAERRCVDRAPASGRSGRCGCWCGRSRSRRSSPAVHQISSFTSRRDGRRVARAARRHSDRWLDGGVRHDPTLQARHRARPRFVEPFGVASGRIPTAFHPLYSPCWPLRVRVRAGQLAHLDHRAGVDLMVVAAAWIARRRTAPASRRRCWSAWHRTCGCRWSAVARGVYVALSPGSSWRRTGGSTPSPNPTPPRYHQARRRDVADSPQHEGTAQLSDDRRRLARATRRRYSDLLVGLA
jgi:hypothetical protein